MHLSVQNPPTVNPSYMKTALLILLVSINFLCSCTITDPQFKSLAAAAETNPPKNAIIGMWHDQASVFGYDDIRASLLFKADGTFIRRASYETIGREVYMETQFWNYAGNGVWTVEMKGPWAGTKTDRYRIARGMLLRETAGGFGPVKRVYRRVE
jgi:hypothetical protein